jgi:hypothetical protein
MKVPLTAVLSKLGRRDVANGLEFRSAEVVGLKGQLVGLVAPAQAKATARTKAAEAIEPMCFVLVCFVMQRFSGARFARALVLLFELWDAQWVGGRPC